MAGSAEPVTTGRFPSRRAARHLPRELRGVRLHEVPAAGPDEPAVGVVEDPRRGHLVAAARVEGAERPVDVEGVQRAFGEHAHTTRDYLRTRTRGGGQ